MKKPNQKYDYRLNSDLKEIDWQCILVLFRKINWRQRLEHEVADAFRKSSHTLFIFDNEVIIAFGRVIGDGRFHAVLADIVVDPAYRKQGLGKYIVDFLNAQLIDYHFVTLTAAPGAGRFYKSLGWKKQTTAYIWPQGPKQLRQHCAADGNVEPNSK
ncbi:GNAT family N-acetyltransferase [Pedobacter aquatilis]|uniref:GNAT family N-acetyltransferase n=1 Tax=Pedobacter aquatilis TaxID=351343 RepID=UPI0029315B4F|nr:GNAT family N-acetyltransferase [Pedobacter aquatilis]